MCLLISIIIPVYNEEKRIRSTLEEIYRYFKDNFPNFEIIVVDDGSCDETLKIVENFKKNRDTETIKIIKNENNKGKGYVVRKGIMEAKGEYVLFTDADLSTPIREFEKLSKYLYEGYDIAIGSRGLEESNIEIRQAFYREVMGKIFNMLVRLILLKDFRDTQCGFKCFKRNVAHKIFNQQKIAGFGFDVEILYRAKKYGYQIREVPIRWLNSKESKVNPVLNSIKMLLDLLKIKFILSKEFQD
jgi:dolichyl-phosphate beta-glucosyltransferase